MIIVFLEKCEAIICGDYSTIAEEYSVPHTFFPGDELEIESAETWEDSEEGETMARIVFVDGTECTISADYFIRIE